MFAFLALLLFLLHLFGARIGSLDLVVAGLACIAAALLLGNWPVGYLSTRFGRQ